VKLYIVVLKSLSTGLKCAQACHALHAFTRAYPDATEQWEADNNIVVLEHEDITSTADMLEALGIDVARFNEPDLDGAMTAICAAPTAKRHLRELRLAA
jgi:hypothetical protein